MNVSYWPHQVQSAALTQVLCLSITRDRSATPHTCFRPSYGRTIRDSGCCRTYSRQGCRVTARAVWNSDVVGWDSIHENFTGQRHLRLASDLRSQRLTQRVRCYCSDVETGVALDCCVYAAVEGRPRAAATASHPFGRRSAIRKGAGRGDSEEPIHTGMSPAFRIGGALLVICRYGSRADAATWRRVFDARGRRRIEPPRLYHAHQSGLVLRVLSILRQVA